MKFLNPAGLWLLLGIPVLIFIYLIRPHHEERAVSSTFMWKLSQKFMKRQLPMQRLQRILLFILQLLLLICAALLIARPALITGKSTEYIAIIDASASMQTKDENGVSRFDRAVEEAKKLTEHLPHGHRVSVILAGDNAQYLIQSADSASRVKLALEGASCGAGGCNTEKAMNLAQQLASRGESEVIFYTDAPSEKTNFVRIENMNKGEWNLSVDALTMDSDDDGNEYVVAAVTSHNRDAAATVGLKMDGILLTAKAVELAANEPAEVSFPVEAVTPGSILQAFVDVNDGLSLDNSYSMCTGYSRVYSVLLLSKSPFYIEKVLQSLENCSVTVTDDSMRATEAGYDLYIYDGIFPEEYPQNGSVLQFGVGNLPDGMEALKEETTPARLSKLSGSHKLYDGLLLTDTTVSVYNPLAGSAKWEKVLTCTMDPVCLTGINDLGMRTTVFSFDLHNSNLPMQTDYVVLMKNIVEASVFDLIPGSDFAVGTNIDLAVLPNAQQMYLDLPDGSVLDLTPEGGHCTVSLNQIGVHTAVVTTAAGGEFADFFVHIPEGENLTTPHGLLSVAPAADTSGGTDAITELWIYVAAAMLVLLILEWGVYFREQY